MAAREMLADPGVGSQAAPVGTEAWAQRVRLNLISMFRHVGENPKEFADLMVFFAQHGGYSLVTDEHGAPFATMNAFCEHRPNWGLGAPYEQVRPYLQLVMGERAEALFANGGPRPDGRATNGASQPRSETGRLLPVATDSSPVGLKRQAPKAGAELRIAATANAPIEIRKLYIDDLIGKVEAAKLGPTKQTPETAAKIRAAVNEAVAIVEAEKPATPKAKRDVKRKVNAKVREVLSAGAPTPPKSFADILTRIAKLSSEDQASLVCEVVEHLDAVHLHRVREVLDERTTPTRGPGREES